ncbi:MAG: hypothetical protein C0434_08410 [Xanthomonadaceae bacterium]|nr:hypothetical protein [Xanthomonadaceae bacterium]
MTTRPAPLLSLAASLLLTACGGSSQDPSPPPAAVYGAAPAPSVAPTAESAGPVPAIASASAPAVGSDSLDYPDDLQLLLLGYRLAGQTPPFETWAQEAQAVRNADEFSRAGVLKAEVERLQAVAASVAGVGYVRVKTHCNLSEYDGGRGGYYLPAFEPGVRYSFEAFRDKVDLQIANSADAYLWPLTPDAARGILQKTGTRAVDVDMHIAITRAARRANGLQLDGRVQDYRVISSQYGNPAVLGTVQLK